jgi:DNA-binding response OmpR family regulator
MMRSCRRILVVAANPALAETVVSWLSTAGHRASVVTDFASAKPELDAHPPDLLVTEIKLGAFNGLHLAIRSRATTPAIVIGDPDCVLEAEARQQQVQYLSLPLDETAFSRAAHDVIDAVH